MIDVVSRLQKHSKFTLIGPLIKNLPKKLQEFVIFVDGGAMALNDLIETPYLTIGDGDSIAKDKPQMQVPLKSEKDFSDLAFVLTQLPNNTSYLHLCGFLGGRLDHQLAVWGEVCQMMEETQNLLCVDFDEGHHKLLNQGPHELNVDGVFSLISLKPQEIRLKGKAKYTLPEFETLMPLNSRGLSNVGYGKIYLETSGPLLLFKSAFCLDS